MNNTLNEKLYDLKSRYTSTLMTRSVILNELCDWFTQTLITTKDKKIDISKDCLEISVHDKRVNVINIYLQEYDKCYSLTPDEVIKQKNYSIFVTTWIDNPEDVRVFNITSVGLDGAMCIARCLENGISTSIKSFNWKDLFVKLGFTQFSENDSMFVKRYNFNHEKEFSVIIAVYADNIKIVLNENSVTFENDDIVIVTDDDIEELDYDGVYKFFNKGVNEMVKTYISKIL